MGTSRMKLLVLMIPLYLYLLSVLTLMTVSAELPPRHEKNRDMKNQLNKDTVFMRSVFSDSCDIQKDFLLGLRAQVVRAINQIKYCLNQQKGIVSSKYNIFFPY